MPRPRSALPRTKSSLPTLTLTRSRPSACTPVTTLVPSSPLDPKRSGPTVVVPLPPSDSERLMTALSPFSKLSGR